MNPHSSKDNGDDKHKKSSASCRLAPQIMTSAVNAWAAQEKNGFKDFVKAQLKVAVVLTVAYFGNVYEPAYPRNDNQAPEMFWLVNGFLAMTALWTWTWKASPASRTGGHPRVVILGREQTEEWKGWMQWAFIFYHYYRVYYVYNEIRVFVSAYVWMTGFGNFLYFDKKGDFSIERFVSMIIRINYFPLLLSYFLSVPLELYYVVPLHTCGFIMTMVSCYIAVIFERKCGFGYWKSRTSAVLVSLIAHVLFYETPAVDVLLYFSKEIHFRFQADKYSAWMGLASGLLWGKVGEYMQWAHGFENESRRIKATIFQFMTGAFLIWFWYFFFGFMSDKYAYNPVHPYVFIFPVAGWLMIRNCSRYLTECHSTVLEFLGRNTLETYVLQFHLFMTHDVQYIPVIIPGADADGHAVLKFLNMLLCGCVFLVMAVWARKITVATQMSVVDLVKSVRGLPTTPSANITLSSQAGSKGSHSNKSEASPENEEVQLVKAESGMSDAPLKG
ncbi:hypothetical protein ACHAXS_009449 [Conticribra weissflogii]